MLIAYVMGVITGGGTALTGAILGYRLARIHNTEDDSA